MIDPETLLTLTADIAASFVANNRLGTSEVSGVIRSVHEALSALGQEVEPEAPVFLPAVTIRKSLADPAKIISMIDGKPYSTLKRHLTRHGLTPGEYRARYSLPADYPTTAPAYSQMRKEMAMTIGLGRKAKVIEVVAETTPAAKGRRKLGIARPAERAPAPAAKAPRKPHALSGKGALATVRQSVE